MDAKKFLQMVEDKKKRLLEKKEAPLKWQQKLEAAIKATEEKEKKLKSKKHRRRSYFSSESDSESESDSDRKHRKRKDRRRHRKHGHSDSDGARRRKHRSKRRSSDSSDESDSDEYDSESEEERRRKKHSHRRKHRRHSSRSESDASDYSSDDDERRSTRKDHTRSRRRRHRSSDDESEDKIRSRHRKRHRSSDEDKPSDSDNHKRHRSRSLSLDDGAAVGQLLNEGDVSFIMLLSRLCCGFLKPVLVVPKHLAKPDVISSVSSVVICLLADLVVKHACFICCKFTIAFLFVEPYYGGSYAAMSTHFLRDTSYAYTFFVGYKHSVAVQQRSMKHYVSVGARAFLFDCLNACHTPRRTPKNLWPTYITFILETSTQCVSVIIYHMSK
ncbi:hypothetical protein TRIUR3_01775 [Triticum urartu]|uniref:Uncharacterized protein n=1 Tax=Triticum urartu TaxID=4572 RepID=M8A867_TRIUA|nr:hypothetical protein TRIUR3_01775 [Triticum urartu]